MVSFGYFGGSFDDHGPSEGTPEGTKLQKPATRHQKGARGDPRNREIWTPKAQKLGPRTEPEQNRQTGADKVAPKPANIGSLESECIPAKLHRPQKCHKKSPKVSQNAPKMLPNDPQVEPEVVVQMD